MKLTKLITFVLLTSSSSLVIAEGDHAGGHGHASAATESAHWMAPAAEASKPNPIQANSASIQTGAELYRQNCVSCHGANADGNGMAAMMMNPKPANLRTMAGMHPDGDFAYKIKVGRGAMPAWKNTLNEHQVWHLVNYIQALNKQPVAAKDEGPGHGHAESHAH